MKRIIPCCLLSLLLSVAARSQPTVSATSPTSQTLCSGSSATFTVSASGTPTLSYQWQSSPNGTAWSNIGDGAVYSGTATASLTISNAPVTLSSYSFRCVVTNSAGSTPSAAGTLTVNASPVAQMSSQSIVQCSTAGTGSALAADPSFNYQWQLSTDGTTWNDITDGAVYTGTTTYDLTWNLSTSMNGYLYRFLITDPTSGCSTTSTGVDTLYVIGSPSVASIAPTNANICPGTNATFAVTDSTGVSYQWQYSTNSGASWANATDGTLYSGSTAVSLAITDPTAAAWYHVIRTVTQHGTSCSTLSTFAPLFIKTNVSIITEPANTTVCEGIAANFRVVAGGTSPLTYQWQSDNGTNPAVWANVGASSALLNTGATTNAMNGYHYQVLVTGACGQLTSTEATLGVHSNGTWLGSADVKWEDAANWCGGVPTATTNVLIPTGTTYSPTISTTTGTAYSAALNILNGAILTINGGITTMSGPFSILGTVAYTATGDQPVLPADHGSLIIGGSGNKTLSANTGISNTLTLGGTAMLVTGNDLLTMYAGSNPIGGAASYGSAASSWIVTGNGNSGAGNTGLGGLRIAGIGSGATAFFPVGPTPTAYAPAQLTNNGAINDFTIAVNDQLIPGGPTNATVDRTWRVSGAAAGTGVITLGLQWNQGDEGSLFNRSSASVIQSNGTNIIQESAIGSAAGGNPYSLTEGGFPTYTQFSVATSTAVVLPVELLSFTGQWLDNNSVGLTWTANQQSQASSFIVQRSSDGGPFNTIGTVEASPATAAYSFIDPQPFAGNNAYRLQISSRRVGIL